MVCTGRLLHQSPDFHETERNILLFPLDPRKKSTNGMSVVFDHLDLVDQLQKLLPVELQALMYLFAAAITCKSPESVKLFQTNQIKRNSAKVGGNEIDKEISLTQQTITSLLYEVRDLMKLPKTPWNVHDLDEIVSIKAALKDPHTWLESELLKHLTARSDKIKVDIRKQAAGYLYVNSVDNSFLPVFHVIFPFFSLFFIFI